MYNNNLSKITFGIKINTKDSRFQKEYKASSNKDCDFLNVEIDRMLLDIKGCKTPSFTYDAINKGVKILTNDGRELSLISFDDDLNERIIYLLGDFSKLEKISFEYDESSINGYGYNYVYIMDFISKKNIFNSHGTPMEERKELSLFEKPEIDIETDENIFVKIKNKLKKKQN